MCKEEGFILFRSRTLANIVHGKIMFLAEIDWGILGSFGFVGGNLDIKCLKEGSVG